MAPYVVSPMRLRHFVNGLVRVMRVRVMHATGLVPLSKPDWSEDVALRQEPSPIHSPVSVAQRGATTLQDYRDAGRRAYAGHGVMVHRCAIFQPSAHISIS